MNSTHFLTLITFATLVTFSSPGLAQYVWIDENGYKQYSDQSPPASIAENKILKFPDDPLSMRSEMPHSKAKEQESLAEKELDYKKRRDDAIAKERKETGEMQAAADKKENCKRMQEYQRNLSSGERIDQIDAKGEHSYMTDAKRAQEQNMIRQHLQDCSS